MSILKTKNQFVICSKKTKKKKKKNEDLHMSLWLRKNQQCVNTSLSNLLSFSSPSVVTMVASVNLAFQSGSSNAI